MKKLIIILLLASKFCSGQSGGIAINDSSGLFIGSDTSISYSQDAMGRVFFRQDVGYEYSQDTVPVFMLVIDTLHYSNYTPQLNDKNYFDKAGATTWVKGNAVRRVTIEKAGSHRSGDMLWFTQKDETTFQTLQYLDSDYKPLAKGIMVWMAQ